MPILKRTGKLGVSYQVRVRGPDGGWSASKTFKSHKEAQTYELKLRSEQASGRHFAHEAAVVTVDRYWAAWSLANRSKVSPGWRLSQDQMFKDHISPVIGKVPMAKVSRVTIGQVMASAEQKGLGEQTRLHIYALLRRMFDDAITYYEMIGKNPVCSKHHRPKVHSVERKFLKPEEAAVLLEATRDLWSGPATWLQVLAGLRVGEAISLKWADVDLREGRIRIRSTWSQKTKTIQEWPKAKDWGSAPIPPELAAYLAGQRRGGEFVCSSEGCHPMSYNAYYHHLVRLCGRLKLPKVSPHELRHTASHLYEHAGASDRDLQNLLNHKDAKSTQKYRHRADDRLKSLSGQVKLRVITGGEQTA